MESDVYKKGKDLHLSDLNVVCTHEISYFKPFFYVIMMPLGVRAKYCPGNVCTCVNESVMETLCSSAANNKNFNNHLFLVFEMKKLTFDQ